MSSVASRNSHSRDCLVRDLEPALQQQLGGIAEAELVAQARRYREEHDVGRVLEIVEWRICPLVEDTPTGAACERALAVAPT